MNEQYDIFNISLNIIVFDISPVLNISISKMNPISGKRWVECTNKGQISIPESIDPETQVWFLPFYVWTFSTIFCCFQFHNFSKWSNIFQSVTNNNFVSHVSPKNPLIFEINFPRATEIQTGSFEGGVKYCETQYVSIILLSDSKYLKSHVKNYVGHS